MHHHVDQGLEDCPLAVLGQIDPGRILPCRNMHVLRCEVDGAGDLFVQQSGDLHGVELTRGPINASIPRCDDAGVGKPLLGVRGAQQYAGDGGA